jgi:hypothetical protein
MRHSTRWLIGFLLATAAIVGGVRLASSSASAASTDDEGPAKIEDIPGSSLKRVILTAEGAHRVGVETARVVRAKQRTVVPYDAVIYDADGATWAYAVRAPYTYVRQRLVVDRIAGKRAYLIRGPAVGTRVVSVGAAEIYGAEVGVGEGE